MAASVLLISLGYLVHLKYFYPFIYLDIMLSDCPVQCDNKRYGSLTSWVVTAYGASSRRALDLEFV